MTKFVFGSYRLQMDVERTRAWHEAEPRPWITCGCAGCRNYVQAVKQMPEAVVDFLAALGLDSEHPAELCYYQGTETTLSGGGWYHICGEILAGAMPVSQVKNLDRRTSHERAV